MSLFIVYSTISLSPEAPGSWLGVGELSYVCRCQGWNTNLHPEATVLCSFTT